MEHPDKLRAASYALIKPLLFRLPTETAHQLGLKVVDLIGRLPAAMQPAQQQAASPVELMGLRFPNRIGLAAGLDKNAAHIDGLAALGFGFLELGTVTPVAQPGNPQPRLFRLPAAEALINRFGFNNDGLDIFVQNVKSSTIWQQREQARQHGQPSNTPLLGLNIGKNARTPIESATEDYLIGLRAVMPLADYITINISSPNTANLRQLQGSEELDGLLGALAAERQKLAYTLKRNPPLLVKIAPDLDEAQIEAIIAALLRHGIDGVIATNTTLSRTAVAGLPHAEEAGGLSGRPVFEASNRVIRALRSGLPPGYPIIGVGGILSGDDAATKLQAGADLVQLYTGLVYRGPSLVTNAGLAVRQYLNDALHSETDARPTRASVP